LQLSTFRNHDLKCHQHNSAVFLIDNNRSNASEYVSGSMTMATQGRWSLNPGTSRNAIGSRYEAKRTYGYRHKQRDEESLALDQMEVALIGGRGYRILVDPVVKQEVSENTGDHQIHKLQRDLLILSVEREKSIMAIQ
jgi:hypothetical protein